jgi:STE24 endopeptidase
MRMTVVALLVVLAALPIAAVPTADAPTGSGARALDVEKATDAYLAQLPAAQRQKTDRYFEGGYWIQLWGVLLTGAILIALLATGLSARMRDFAARRTRWKWLQSFIYAELFIVLLSILEAPFGTYTDFFREHQYGLSNQSFVAFMKERLLGLAIGMILGGLLITGILGVVRRFQRSWWMWAAVVMIVFEMLTIAIAPLFIAPLFNDYTELTDARVRDPILTLARQNGIPASHVFVVDESRQTTRISANVMGLFGTTRISLNDNLLRRCSLGEIEMVMAHEMGHYVLHHVPKGLTFIGLVIVMAFAFVQWAGSRSLAKVGERWRLGTLGDPATLPLLILFFVVAMFVATPLLNTITRVDEAEADIFGLNASRQPDAFATVALKLGEYRKLAPGKLEEMFFFDHPSGRSRIRMAMEWKREEMLRASSPAR